MLHTENLHSILHTLCVKLAIESKTYLIFFISEIVFLFPLGLVHIQRLWKRSRLGNRKYGNQSHFSIANDLQHRNVNSTIKMLWTYICDFAFAITVCERALTVVLRFPVCFITFPNKETFIKHGNFSFLSLGIGISSFRFSILIQTIILCHITKYK